MAAPFTGLRMRVVLRDPPDFEISGIVQDVEAGTSLTLVNAFLPHTNETRSHMRIDAANILDLSEIKLPPPTSSQSATPTYAAQDSPTSAQVAIFSGAPAPTSASFVDPAIMSFNRRPSSMTPTGVATTPALATPAATGAPGGDWGLLFRHPSDRTSEESGLGGPFDNLSLHPPDRVDASKNGHATTSTAEGATVTKKKRTRARKSKVGGHQMDEQHAGGVASPSGQSPSAHGKGWRQTPILQSNASFQPFNSLKQTRGSRKDAFDNGWASEDVTEELPEFDFEVELAKFDKRTIFDQMRKEDKVDEDSRLVSHNRKPKPGTAGGKNLHYTEMVLDIPSTIGPSAYSWNSEADVAGEAEERPLARDAKAAPHMRRADSKSGVSRRSQSRKASAGGPLGVGDGHALSRVNSSQGFSNATYPVTQEGFYRTSTGKRLETISTLQMLNLENIAANELGFTEELMAENAGRGIAEVAVTALSDPAIKVRFELASRTSQDGPGTSVSNSTVVVLAGNNKSGIRALAAARHLRNKSINVVVCLVGIERERDLLEDLRRQISMYRNFGGKVLNKHDFFEHMRKPSATGARATVSLIIDAILGLTISFEELRIGDQATVYELMEWANRNEAYVLAVDVPTGIDPSTGKIAIIDGSQLFVKPRYVVAIGAPKKGLLEAVRPPGSDEPESFTYAAQDEEWQLFVVDLGLGSSVWRKAGTKARRGIDFDGRWVLEMQYRGADVASDEEV